MKDYTPEELRKDLENRRHLDLFYDVEEGFIDMLVKDHEVVEQLKKRIKEIKFKFEGVTMDHYAENELDELERVLNGSS